MDIEFDEFAFCTSEEGRREILEKRKAAARDKCFSLGGFYRNCTFDTDDGKEPEPASLCRKYADAFDPETPFGLLLWGDVGTGKSFMSSAIANRVIDRGFAACQMDIGQIARILESSFENRQKNLKRIFGYDLLLIEDLGAQRSTSYMMEHVYTVIDGCYKAGVPMVITTNFSLGQITCPESGDLWERVFDRILERCYPIKFTVPRRKGKTVKMREEMRARLKGGVDDGAVSV